MKKQMQRKKKYKFLKDAKIIDTKCDWGSV